MSYLKIRHKCWKALYHQNKIGKDPGFWFPGWIFPLHSVLLLEGSFSFSTVSIKLPHDCVESD